jgi:hypothetical protein
MADPPKAKVKKAKKKTKYSATYQDTFKWVCPVTHPKRDEFMARCTICSCDFSISHSGIGDVRKHGQAEKHISHTSKMQNPSTPGLREFFPSVEDYDVIRAECLMTEFIVEHNLPFSVADHATRLVKKMFPDSKIAAKYASGQTKTSCVVRSLAANEMNSWNSSASNFLLRLRHLKELMMLGRHYQQTFLYYLLLQRAFSLSSTAMQTVRECLVM